MTRLVLHSGCHCELLSFPIATVRTHFCPQTAITGSIVQAFFGLCVMLALTRLKLELMVPFSRVKWLTGNRWLGWGIIVAAFLQFRAFI